MPRLLKHRDDLDLDANHSQWVRDVTTGMLVLAVIFVSFRFLARWLKGLKVGLDDWLLLAALAFLFTTGALNYAMIAYGLGRQAKAISQETLETFLKLLVVSQIIFTTGLMLVKVSILQLYLRIFPSKRFKIAVYIITGVVISWWTAITLLTIFQCKPIEMSYKPWIDGHCIELYGAYYGSGIPDITVDFIILCLPLRQVVKLNTTLGNKLVISFFFASGAFATFASINRLIVVFQVDHLNGTWTLTEPLGWAIIEQASAVVSACLPTLRPLLVKVYEASGLSVRSRSTNQNREQWNSELITIGGSSGYRAQDRKFLRLTNEGEGIRFSTEVSALGLISREGVDGNTPEFQGGARNPNARSQCPS